MPTRPLRVRTRQHRLKRNGRGATQSMGAWRGAHEFKFGRISIAADRTGCCAGVVGKREETTTAMPCSKATANYGGLFALLRACMGCFRLQVLAGLFVYPGPRAFSVVRVEGLNARGGVRQTEG
jgi:hypothetical protein